MAYGPLAAPCAARQALIMNIEGSVVLVTGANRGIGAEWVRQLRERGARKVYAAARDPQSVAPAEGVVPLALDVTDQVQAQAAAAQASDVQILVNNAGIAVRQPLVGGDLGQIRQEFEVNVFGPLYVAEAFAPVLKANGGGAIVSALSTVSWFSFPGMAGYSATKAAAWSLTDALRLELAEQGTQVLALHEGPVSTPMGDNFPISKISPDQPVTAALDGLEAGATEVVVDDVTRFVKSTLTDDPSRYAAILGGGN
jgi:NAD(P)-dependent dehydrogenase (short-subunit alcohol dehydrogenase family)